MDQWYDDCCYVGFFLHHRIDYLNSLLCGSTEWFAIVRLVAYTHGFA